jgi:hypothetical protein
MIVHVVGLPKWRTSGLGLHDFTLDCLTPMIDVIQFEGFPLPTAHSPLPSSPSIGKNCNSHRILFKITETDIDPFGRQP